MADAIKRLTIAGFKSIQRLEDFELKSLNVLIGANGAGKSNFVGLFRILRELTRQNLQVAVKKEGGADACLYMGPRVTQQLVAKLYFGNNSYEFILVPASDQLVFAEELFAWSKGGQGLRKFLGSGHVESELKESSDEPGPVTESKEPYRNEARDILDTVSNWVVYHFHDTSSIAAVRREGGINDNEFLRPDASNLAAFLFRIRHSDRSSYDRIRDVVRLAAPFFDDFKLRPDPINQELIKLEWLQKGSDYTFRASQLSDGTLRFMCLATALIQPSPPPTMLFDEPELGLHPYALTLLAGLFQQAALQHGNRVIRQVIVSTQSAPLLNEFSPEDIIIVERSQGQSTFRRLERDDLTEWLKEYALGELWQKNVLGGRPGNEESPQLLGAKSSNGGDTR